MTRDNEFVTEAEFDEMLEEIDKAVRTLERQVERLAEQRARADAAVRQDIERRLQIIEKMAQVPVSPRERTRQQQRDRQDDRVAGLYKRAADLEQEDRGLAEGLRQLAAEAAEKGLE